MTKQELKKIKDWICENEVEIQGPREDVNIICSERLLSFLEELQNKICDCEIPKPIDPFHPEDKFVCRECSGKLSVVQ